MKNTIFKLILLIILLPVQTLAISLPETYSDKVLIYDLTEDEIIQQKNIDVKSNIASLTKIITTITAIENIPNLEQEVTITTEMLSNIPSDASRAGLEVGETYTVRDLLYASILPSGADATDSLAYTSAGSIPAFVEKMNNLAKQIGATNTNFINTTGYDIDNHYSTIEDLLKIIKYALNNPDFKTIFCTKEHQMKNGKVVKWTIDMYNKQMNLNVDRLLGSKTGYTKKTGLAIAALFKAHNHDFLMITLGAKPYIYGNFYNLRDAVKLIDFIDHNYGEQTLIEKNTLIKSIPVKFSKNDNYDIKTNNDITKFLPKDYDLNDFKYEYIGTESISFMTSKNSKLGKVRYYYKDEILSEEDIFMNEKQTFSIFKIFHQYWHITLLIIVLILLKLISKTKRKKKKRKKKY